ncbi:low temperature requirement protein A, partial [Staphylococcus aureus]|uniref:low temperature requirement protein A n=1 Tax=Staphylococcus aureus TaxID=1280 RepID=UPI00210C12C5
MEPFCVVKITCAIFSMASPNSKSKNNSSNPARFSPKCYGANALTPKHLAEKRAGFHEVFFDLIFVYAIKKIAHVILTTQNGTISADLFFKYIVMSLFLWLMWSHQTFFTNRYGLVTFKDVSFM